MLFPTRLRNSDKTLLGAVNCLLAIPYVAMLYGIFFNYPPKITIDSVVHQYLPNLVFFFSLGINVYLGYKLLWKHYDQTKFKQYLVLTFLTIFWFIWLFIGYLFASEIIYFLVSSIIIAVIFIFLRKFSIRWAIMTSFVTLLVLIMVVAFAFEEDYCWKKGDEIAVGKPDMITISAQEAGDVMSGGIYNPASSSAEVGTAAYYHFKCHQNFDFSKALKEKYLLLK